MTFRQDLNPSDTSVTIILPHLSMYNWSNLNRPLLLKNSDLYENMVIKSKTHKSYVHKIEKVRKSQITAQQTKIQNVRSLQTE